MCSERGLSVPAGLVGHQRLPLRPLLLGLPDRQVVLHQGPARGEFHFYTERLAARSCRQTGRSGHSQTPEKLHQNKVVEKYKR